MMLNERKKLLADHPPQLPQIRQLQVNYASNEVVWVNRGEQPNKFVAAGTCYPRKGLRIRDYTVFGVCEPFTSKQYDRLCEMLVHPHHNFFSRHYRKITNSLIFNHPRREMTWYKWRSTILLSFMVVSLMTWGLIFYLNPFASSIHHYAKDFAEDFANLGEGPQEGIEHQVEGILKVLVYVAVTQSIVTLGLCLGRVIDLFAEPTIAFAAPFDNGTYSIDSPNDAERGHFICEPVEDARGTLHELVRVHDRWWLLQTDPQLLVQDENFALLPVNVLQEAGEPILLELRRLAKPASTINIRGRVESRAELVEVPDDILTACSLLHAAAQKTMRAVGLPSLLPAACSLASALQGLATVFAQHDIAKLPPNYQGMAELLSKVPNPAKGNKNQDDDDNDNDQDPVVQAKYLNQITKYSSATDPASLSVITLVNQVNKGIASLQSSTHTAQAMVNDEHQAAARNRIFNGQDLMRDSDPSRPGFHELDQQVRRRK